MRRAYFQIIILAATGILPIFSTASANAQSAKPDAGLTFVVPPGSEADQKGIRNGDVISAVNGKPINTSQDLDGAFDAARKRGEKNRADKNPAGKG